MADIWICSYGVPNCPVCLRDNPNAAEMVRRIETFNRKVPQSHRVYLAVPYAEKDQAKGLGARWDAQRRLWYADGRESIIRFERWYRSARNVAKINTPIEKAATTDISYNELMDALADANGEQQEQEKELEYIELAKIIQNDATRYSGA